MQRSQILFTTVLIFSLIVSCKPVKSFSLDKTQEVFQRAKGTMQIVDSKYRAKNKEAGSLNREGIKMSRLGRYKKAKELFAKAIELEESNAAYHTNLGLAEMFLKNYSDAEKHMLKSIELNPRDSNSFMNLGSMYQAWEKYDEANYVNTWIVENLEGKIEMGLIYMNLVQTHSSQGLCDKAKEYYRKAENVIDVNNDAYKAMMEKTEGYILECQGKDSMD